MQESWTLIGKMRSLPRLLQQICRRKRYLVFFCICVYLMKCMYAAFHDACNSKLSGNALQSG